VPEVWNAAARALTHQFTLISGCKTERGKFIRGKNDLKAGKAPSRTSFEAKSAHATSNLGWANQKVA
jgi:hypothetical protein